MVCAGTPRVSTGLGPAGLSCRPPAPPFPGLLERNTFRLGVSKYKPIPPRITVSLDFPGCQEKPTRGLKLVCGGGKIEPIPLPWNTRPPLAESKMERFL